MDWTVVGTEVEALQLEYSWIKEFDPRFNVRYRDDKSYPYLAVTMDEEYPRVMVLRGAKRRGVRYFGPYSHAWAIRETVDALLRVFPVRTCSAGVFKRAGQIGRPCLLGYIGKCSAPCVQRVSAAEHRLLAEEFCDFMAGQTDRFIQRLEAEMRRAARGRGVRAGRPAARRHPALQRALEKQAVVLSDGTDCDVIALAEDQLEAAVQVFYVRGGRVRGQRGWVVDKVEDVTPERACGALPRPGLRRRPRSLAPGPGPPATPRASGPDGAEVTRRADREGSVPREVLVPVLPPDAGAVEEWLADRRGSRVSLRVPRRGDKKALLETVARNAAESLALHKTRRASDLTTRSRALHEIQEALGLTRRRCGSSATTCRICRAPTWWRPWWCSRTDWPARRSTAGSASGATGGTDDVASVHEVITRRFRRYLEEREATGELDVLGWDADEPPDDSAAAGGGRRGAQIRLSAEPGGDRRGPGPGGGGRPGPRRTRHRRRQRLRPGQAA